MGGARARNQGAIAFRTPSGRESGHGCPAGSGSRRQGLQRPPRRYAHREVRQRECGMEQAAVPLDAAAAGPDMPESPLHDEEGVLRLGAHRRLPRLHALLGRERAVQALHRGGLPGDGLPHRWEVRAGGGLGALRRPGASGVRMAEPVVPADEGMGHGHAGHVGGSRLHGMHEAAARIDADVRLEAEMPALPLPGLVGPGAAGMPPVLGGARRLDEGRVHDGASPHHGARRPGLRAQPAEHGLAEALPLEDVAELCFVKPA